MVGAAVVGVEVADKDLAVDGEDGVEVEVEVAFLPLGEVVEVADLKGEAEAEDE
jgi:hypothetical protein